jgi:hypothetical protein
MLAPVRCLSVWSMLSVEDTSSHARGIGSYSGAVTAPCPTVDSGLDGRRAARNGSHDFDGMWDGALRG